jgi:hypothetical protein
MKDKLSFIYRGAHWAAVSSCGAKAEARGNRGGGALELVPQGLVSRLQFLLEAREPPLHTHDTQHTLRRTRRTTPQETGQAMRRTERVAAASARRSAAASCFFCGPPTRTFMSAAARRWAREPECLARKASLACSTVWPPSSAPEASSTSFLTSADSCALAAVCHHTRTT